MADLLSLLDDNRITISLYDYGKHDLSIGWEVKSIVDNPEIFDDFFEKYPLKGIDSLDDYCLYLLAVKFTKMREYLPVLAQEEHKEKISNLADKASVAISGIKIGDAIRFINGNAPELMLRKHAIHDLYRVTLDLIAQYCLSGIDKSVLEHLCDNYGYMLIDRYDQFEKCFEKHPDLFNRVFPTGQLERINPFRFEKVLGIWSHIIKKDGSKLKPIVERHIDELYADVEKLAESIDSENVIHYEGTVREFGAFLHRIKSLRAKEFDAHVKKTQEILDKYIQERGHVFSYEIPVKEVIDKWKATDVTIAHLLSLTHKHAGDTGEAEITSLLSNVEVELSMAGFISTNIPTDAFFTPSRQRKLSFLSATCSAVIMGILRDEQTIDSYLSLMLGAIKTICQQTDIEDDDLVADMEYWARTVHLFADNTNSDEVIVRAMSYSVAMFTFALMEKVLRSTYFHETCGKLYVSQNNATMGTLLSENNSFINNIFGTDHIKHLAFFILRDPDSQVGENMRNSLAHWSGLKPNELEPYFTTKTIWLFTDVVNTILLHYLGKAE